MRIAMVTSWGTACGIAEYSRYLMDATSEDSGIEYHVLAPEEPVFDAESRYPVSRCWRIRSTDVSALSEALVSIRPDLVHIQFQWAYYSSDSLRSLIAAVRSAGLPVLVTFHTIADLPNDADSLSRARDALAGADLLLVHTPNDVPALQSMGLESNVRLTVIGNFVAADEDIDAVRASLELTAFNPIIASFGFLQPHKGILQAVESIALLRETHPDVLYLAVCATQQNSESQWYRQECIERARELGIADRALILGKFLSNAEVLAALHASDLVVLPYHPTSESSSSAMTFALSSRRPVITTAQPIFSNIADVVRQIASPEPQLIADAVEELLADRAERDRLVAAASEYIDSTSWPVVAARYVEDVRQVMAARGSQGG